MNIREESLELGQAILNAIASYSVDDNHADILCTLQDDIYNILSSNTRCKVWREDEFVQLPTYAKNGDACCDIYAHSIEYKDDRIIIHTGLHFAIPTGYEMEIRPRSSLTKLTYYIPNAPGTLDEGYRGEMLVVFRHINNLPAMNPDNPVFKVGDRVGQLLIRRVEKIEWEEVEKLEDLGETERGQNGYGSTGK